MSVPKIFHNFAEKSAFKTIAMASIGLLSFSLPNLSHAAVMAGYDIFLTGPHSHEGPLYFQGVGLGNYDFGGAIGIKNLGNADTIIHRTSTVNSEGGNTGLTIDALQLVTTTPTNLLAALGLGSANGYYYATLNTNAPSTGAMTINGVNASSGTYSSNLKIYLDFQVCDSLNVNGQPSSCHGTVFKEIVDLTGLNSWVRVPSEYNAFYNTAPTAGVDYLLNGSNTNGDFWPVINSVGLAQVIPSTDPCYTSLTNCTPASGLPIRIAVEHKNLPEPATLSLFAIGLGLFGFRRRKVVNKI